MSSDTPISISLENVSLRSFLRLMLRQLDLTYMVNDVMHITTIEAAERHLRTRMYSLSNNHLVEKSDKLLAAMQSAIEPDTWSALGGPSTATALDHVLIVSTTDNVHHQVEDFLNTLIEIYGSVER